MHCLAIIGEQDITFYNIEDNHPFSFFVPFRVSFFVYIQLYIADQKCLSSKTWFINRTIMRKRRRI